ncbi:hypothetical protein ARAM_001547 [Aspergillus rambellii]|uniref:MIT domain-containing protein n=1 Tax=Aspergillus rambellii TaxID=308745 RepID=A0A0F8USM8_9EURO|nr:hypothetical protein ARAM_001547 [Aspergillus rambellii]
MPESATGGVSNSPPNTADDGNIREGLGSLNRWSQSTASSNLSTTYVSHRRQESAPRAFIVDGYDSHKRGLSLETSTHLPARAFNPADNGEEMLTQYHSQHSILHGHAETPPLISQKRSESMPLESTYMPPEIVSKRHSPEMETLNQPAGGYSTHTVVRPSSQNEKRRQVHSQKVMLSKALQKANTAVLLDNAANFEGAMEAYNDACQLLQLVMLRSNGGEDEKLKLQEIRDTYMIRVTELQRMDFAFRDADSKALPERPLSQESYGEYLHPVQDYDDDNFVDEDPTLSQHNSFGVAQENSGESGKLAHAQIPPRRQSLLPLAVDDGYHKSPLSPDPRNQEVHRPQPELSSQAPQHVRENSASTFAEHPALDNDDDDDDEGIMSHNSHSSELSMLSQARDVYESTSWLDTIDESGASSSASVRSKASSIYLRRRRSSRLSHGTEADFDAALDAAVEAAYDDGLEPASDLDEDDSNDDIFVNARRNVEIAKQKVREAEREAEVAMTRGRELRRIQEQEMLSTPNDPDLDYLDEEAEEEERLLEEMTRGYVMDDFEFDLQSKSALPRQSGSVSFSTRMWEGPTVPNPIGTGPPLSTLVEDDVLPPEFNTRPHTQSTISSISPQSVSQSTSGSGVRARRMSGQNRIELKIETNPRLKSGAINAEHVQSLDAQIDRPPTPIEKDGHLANLPAHASKSSDTNSSLHSIPPMNRRNISIGSISEDTSANLTLARATATENDEGAEPSKILSPPRPIGKVPSAPDNLGRPNPSMPTFRPRNVSVPGIDFSSDSPGTPASSAFPTLDLQKGAVTAPLNVLPTPSAANFTSSGLPGDALYLFDNYIHSPTNPGSPNPLASDSPLPLEPCPESFLLRPFWLMRCIYQTIAHPRGGYLSTKLFVPCDVWRVKNVKIKGVEEKVSSCDLLTAAMLKLSKVDMYDADAVLEEMQAFEVVLDQVQMSLSKKIGNEVGVQGAMTMFKAALALDDTATLDTISSRASTATSKSYLSSWRKLRSKNSGFGTGPLPSSKEANKDNLSISSLPMTSTPIPQLSKRNVAQLQFSGPNANYMSALARLCDAAQVLDQIAQQVEDPGLRHSSKTLVGLELSTRHAAEFFGFYICRFALNDIGIMLDKFIKRGSEWVLI